MYCLHKNYFLYRSTIYHEKLKNNHSASVYWDLRLFQTPVFATEETAVAASSGVTTNGTSGWPQGPEITSASAVIMEDTSDTILYAKDMDTTLSPAGAVKIMTCLLALENSQLDDQVTMTETGVSGVTDGGAHISTQL